mgnify:FL=1
MRAAARLLLAIVVTAALLAVLLQAVAYATWWLSGAGSTPLADLSVLVAPQRAPEDALVRHTVSEWPPERPRIFREAPALQALVSAGQLPPVAQRLPAEPLVITPPQRTGPYGGVWRRLARDQTTDLQVQILWRIGYEPLIRWDTMGRGFEPNLASQWIVDDQATTYIFRLRRGVKWSDGRPFTADDILFWFNDIICFEELVRTPPNELQRGGTLVQVEKLDELAVRFRFAEPYGLFPRFVASSIWATDMVGSPAHYLRQFHPRHVDRQKLQADARAAGHNTWQSFFEEMRSWRNPGLPTLMAWQITVPPPALQVVCQRNPYYWKVDPEGNQLPYIDTITFDVTDAETLMLRAMSGEVGMQFRGLSPDRYPLLMERQSSGGYEVRHWVGGAGVVIALNLNHRDPALRAVFNDRRFRIALSHAIDRDEINRIALYGAGEPRQCAPSRASPFAYEPLAHAHIEHDPARAAAMLDELGLRLARDGVRRLSDGRPLRLAIETMETNSAVVHLVAEHWTRLGVRTDVKEEARQLFYARKAAALHDAVATVGGAEGDPVLEPRFYLPHNAESNQAVLWAQWFQSNGRQGEAPPDEVRQTMDLYRQIERAPDPRRQVELFHRILQLNAENLWVIGTVAGMPVPVVVRNGGDSRGRYEKFWNVPDVAATEWVFRSPGNTAPECYSITTQEGQ